MSPDELWTNSEGTFVKEEKELEDEEPTPKKKPKLETKPPKGEDDFIAAIKN